MRASLWHEFRHAFAVHPERVAVRERGIDLTYGELERWSAAVAARLAAEGVGAGDPIALYLRNRKEFVVADVAIARLGAVKVPINFMLPEDTVRSIIERTAARAVIVGDELTAAVPSGPVTLQVGDGTPLTSGWLPFPDTSDSTKRQVDSEVGPDDPAAIYFTGGTTGRPKGVVHTQGSTVALHHAQLLEAELADSDRLLLMTPLAHAAGLFAQSALIRGATIVLADRFDPALTLRLIEEEAVTWTFLVPTMIYRLIDLLEQRSPVRSRLRTVVYGAAPITPSRLERALHHFGPVFIQLYGQTESPNWGTRLTRADHDPARLERLTSCGRASILADVKVVDEHGDTVPAGTVGEICLRTPYLLREYLDDPEATAAKFLDGWIRTGDLGLLDEEGYVYLKDRKHDMVITGGMNVYCREVEDVLGRHDGVGAVAVIGIPHEDWGESVHACVVRTDPGLTETALLSWSRQRLAAYANPKSVEFVDSLPETPFGKIDKKALRARHWEGRDRAIG